MHDHTSGGSTTLSGCAHRAKKDRLHRHVEIGAWRNDERIVAAKFHDSSAEATVNILGNVHTHVDRTCGGHQRNPRIIGQLLSNCFAIAHEQSENCRISTSFATDALGNLSD